VLEVNRDITRRKQAEAALRKSERWFRALVQDASDVVLVVGPDGRIRYASPSCRALFGSDPADVVGTEGALLVHPDDLPIALGCFAAVSESGQSTRAAYRVRHAAGRWRHVETSFTNLLHEPAVRGFVLNSRDVTERTEAEADLRRSERQLNAAQRLSGTGSWDCDLVTGSVRWSDECLRILGLGPDDETSFDAMARTVHPEDFERASALWQRAFATGWSEDDVRIVWPDGSIRTLHAAIEVTFDPAGQPVHLMGTAQDVTERRRLEASLLQAQRLESVGRLAAGVAHEINTPVQYVGDNVRFLEEALEKYSWLLGRYRAALEAGGAALPCEELRLRLVVGETQADIAFFEEEIPGAIQGALDGVDRVARIVKA
jgi:two-component system NtrC family sensor kinase